MFQVRVRERAGKVKYRKVAGKVQSSRQWGRSMGKKGSGVACIWQPVKQCGTGMVV